MKRALLLAIAACGRGTQPTPPPRTRPPQPAPLRPHPGLDLAGPIPLPDRTGPVHRTPLPELDLVADRAVVKVSVPVLPRGASAPLSFGAGGTGWAARVPDGTELPALAYGDGRIYASGGFESVNFYALDARTGRFVWATKNLEDNGPTAPVFEDDRVIFNTESCTLFALDARTGKRLWFRWLGDPTLAQTAVADGLVFASHPGTEGQDLSAYRVHDGAPVWSRRIDGELLAAPVVAGDSVYASTIGGTTYRFARATGRLAWRRHLAATTAPWIAGDELYVTRGEHGHEQQIVVSVATGKVERAQPAAPGRSAGDVPDELVNGGKDIWQFEGSRPVIDRGIRYVAMGGELVASDAETGEPLWRRRYARKAGARSLGSVALAGSAIVVATRDGQLFGLDIDTGYTLWSYAVGHRIHAEPIVAKGWVYAATDDGYVIALHVADPTLDGWHMFGGNAWHDGAVARI